MDEFLETYKNIKVGDKVSLDAKYVPPINILWGLPAVDYVFADYIGKHKKNEFTIESIQEFEDDEVLVSFVEVRGCVNYAQIQVLKKKPTKIFNWQRKNP